MTDEEYMKIALGLAGKAYDTDEAPIGAIVVTNDGEIIGEGYNLRETHNNPVAHAEIIAIREAAEHMNSWRLINCTLYVTLEPCPMCAGAIINSRINRVVYGAYDPKAGSVHSVTNLFSLPYNHKPEAVGGVLEQECAEILSRFFRSLRQK